MPGRAGTVAIRRQDRRDSHLIPFPGSTPPMIRRIRKLLAQPGFRAEPLRVLGRAAAWAAMVLARRSPVFKLTEGGERVRVPADLRFTSVTTYLLRDWTEPELRRLDLFVGPGDVFVDIGANIGIYALKGARLVGPTGRVVAVEPGSDAGRQLAANLALNDWRHVVVVPKALSASEGEATLHHIPMGEDPQAFSLLPGDGHEAGEKVRTTTLDRLAEELALPRIDCIKIDVEGAEHLVLEGAQECLVRWHPILVMEINCPTGVASGAAPDTAWNRLAALGYRFQRLVDGRLQRLEAMPAEFGNVIAHHPDGPALRGR